MPLTVHDASDSDDDEDIFTMGNARPLSIYSADFRTGNNQISSSSEDEAVQVRVAPLQAQNKRGRPAKRGRKGRAGTAARSSLQAAAPPKVKKAKVSVFDISSGDEDEVEEVTPRSISPPRRDSMDEAAALQLANARRALENANEKQIQEEAESLAYRDIMLAEIKCEEEKKRKARLAKIEEVKKKRVAALATETPIVLKVRCDDKATMVRIRRTDPVLKMLPHFCKKFGLDVGLARMLCDGEDVTNEDTPDGLDLEDKMVIDVVMRKSR